jgi:hypothetical protein
LVVLVSQKAGRVVEAAHKAHSFSLVQQFQTPMVQGVNVDFILHKLTGQVMNIMLAHTHQTIVWIVVAQIYPLAFGVCPAVDGISRAADAKIDIS